MTATYSAPARSYGVLQQDQSSSPHEDIAEQIRRLGYAILDSGFSDAELAVISGDFNRMRDSYIRKWGEENLRGANELHTIRAAVTHGGPSFLRLIMNPELHAVIRLLIPGKYFLNQQNGIINPPGQTYSQAIWHRDLPYQHFTTSTPLAVNALFCVDDFTAENGSTFVLPASHKSAAFPSETYIRKHALQVEAKAGQYILLDCMTFHGGGFNRTQKERRAVNHVFNIPYFKQQIALPANISADGLSDAEKEMLGFTFQEPASLDAYLASRIGK